MFHSLLLSFVVARHEDNYFSSPQVLVNILQLTEHIILARAPLCKHVFIYQIIATWVVQFV